ncbi:hypothetical protein [Pelagicoccus mobilis]|uniref:Uncharacterized protein n=1 Tax=Pelagicoccus mobilis TaxID=415221 RepID=A0A934RYX8_9BACT|nr:hypothetical protein [Pelagicoccus mobilis]MBK1880270.1 hypothetical protein [Pelagicoccus mobilis]
MPLPESQDHLFEHKVGGGALALFGLPFAIAGLAVMFGPLFSSTSDAPLYFHLPFGSVFFLVGSAFIFGRYRISVDKRQGEVTRQWSLLIPVKTKTQSLDGENGVRITHEIRKSKNSSYSVYPVSLQLTGDDDIEFESSRSLQKARRLGEELAKFLQTSLTDASQGSTSTRQADELDLNLKQRLQSGRIEADIPPPPNRLLSKIEFDGDRLKVEIPPPGFNLGMLFGIVPVIGFMGFAFFVVLRPILRDGTQLPLPVILFMLFFFSIPGSIVLGILGRMFLFRQTLLADSSIVSHSRGWLFHRNTSLPCDKVEEILLGRSGNGRAKLSGRSGQAILIQTDDRSIRVTNHLPPRELDYLLSLLRAVIAS